MTKQLAETYLYELYNVADHVTSCTQNARAGISYSADLENVNSAIEFLEACRRSAEHLDMRYRDAIRALQELRAAGNPKSDTP